MKKIWMLSLFAALFATEGTAQINGPVTWSYEAKKTGQTEAVVFIKATIAESWHIYSQFTKDQGPAATVIIFAPSNDYALVGAVVEPKPIVRMEKLFGVQVACFEKVVIFQQLLKLKKDQVTISGRVDFMSCNDLKCLPPDELEFSILVK